MKSDGDPLISAKRSPQSKLTPHSKHSQLTEIVVVDPLIRAKSLPVQQIDYLAKSHSQIYMIGRRDPQISEKDYQCSKHIQLR